LYNHAESVKKSSLNACGYCHQPVYCATCHSSEVTDGMTSPEVQLDLDGNGTIDPNEETSPSPAPSDGVTTISGAAATIPPRSETGTSAS
jgi:hypothetical protein